MGAVVEDLLRTRLELVGLGSFYSDMSRGAEAFGLFERAQTKAARQSLVFGLGTAAAAVGIGTALAGTVREAGNMQAIQQGFKTTLGSADAAKAKIGELQQFAATTPFDFAQSAHAAQTLLAMGISADRLVPIMRSVGNATAAAGGDTEMFLRALRAIGQISTKGRLSQEEVNQLSEAGIPAMKILQEELGLTAAQMQNLGGSGIDAKKAIEALTRGFDKKFGTAMSDQMNSLNGATSNLKDSWNQAQVALGTPLLVPVTEAVKGVTGLIDLFNKAPEAVKTATTAVATILVPALVIGAVKAGLAAVEVGKLASENVRLSNEALKAGQQAEGEAGAEKTLGGVLQTTLTRTESLRGETGLLAKAHWDAARGAEAQALAERGIGGGLPGAGTPRPGSGLPLPGGVTLPGKPGSGGKPTGTTTVGDRTIQLTADELKAGHAAIDAEKAAAAAATAAKVGSAVGEAGILARAGKAISSPLAFVGAIAADFALSALPEKGAAGTVKHTAQPLIDEALTGAMLGGMLGSVVPVLGNGIGALVGAGLGAAHGGITGFMHDQQVNKTEVGVVGAKGGEKPAGPKSEQQITNELLAEIAKILGQTQADGKFPMNTNVLPAREQINTLAALSRARTLRT